MIGRKTTGCAGAVMSIQIRRGSEPSGRTGELERGAGVKLEHDAGDLDVVAGGEARALERADHAQPVQAPLDVGERLLVLEVVAGDQAIDDVAGDAELARAEALDLELARGGRAIDAVLGELVGRVEQ